MTPITQETIRLQQAQERTAHWRRWGPYLDSTPTHSYMRYLYKYPQVAFPYSQLVEENRQRNRHAFEYELMDTGVFNEDRYCDVVVEYAKATTDDILIRITATNRGPDTADLHLLPTLWFRHPELREHIETVEKPDGNVRRLLAITTREQLPCVLRYMLDQMARHAVDFWLTTEDLPDPNNRISVNARGEIQLQYTCNNQEPTRRLEAKLHSMLEHLGCHKHLIPNNLYLGKHIPIAGVGHQAGTCRFGTDPATSVLDINCKAHELDNLYVVDTSFFPSIAAVNPSLTAMANALRVGDHLLERLG